MTWKYIHNALSKKKKSKLKNNLKYIIIHFLIYKLIDIESGFPGSSAGKKNPSAMQETLVQSLGQEDLPEEGMEALSRILAGRRIPTDRGAWQATVHRVANSQTRLK